jgi:hypothetical protein
MIQCENFHHPIRFNIDPQIVIVFPTLDSYGGGEADVFSLLFYSHEPAFNLNLVSPTLFVVILGFPPDQSTKFSFSPEK